MTDEHFSLADEDAGTQESLEQGMDPAPTRPEGSDEDSVTASGQMQGDSLDQRLAREVPDDAALDNAAVGRLVENESEVGEVDTTPESVAREVGDEGNFAPEELAMHIEEAEGT